ncbi:glycoside hydrolase family 3 protein [Planobacterium oryzisoli]|uniref:beta-N-acetylhexosaminidase n=1 Tax=Planobacterium oryzisoli TaxID=2771435 RepID=A0A931E7H4_9FLAO|nr:glycoside hydrolase family 3 N-terminal domain-containing protein [Planobacterium oryzisoli]MBF5027186.1 glycoside hydrolase family 3 protein [Planobacterium oryzisoli]
MRNFPPTAYVLYFLILSIFIKAQYQPRGQDTTDKLKAELWVEQTYQSLSMDERLGQLFIVALYNNKGPEHIEAVRSLVENEKIGGLILMQDDAAVHIEELNRMHQSLKIPLLVGMDAEWGLYQRILSAQKLPWAITLGAIQDKQLISEMASQIARDAKKTGVYWNFAPVVDVNTNPSNPIIGNRSFGSSVQNVVASARAYAQGLQREGVLAAIKHFPGHGDTSTDSHHDLPVVDHPLSRLETVELAPFKQMLSDGVGGVMIAHLYVPALEKSAGVPASLSHSIITGLFKEKYGYKGLIITDALNMGAVAKRYAPGEVDYLAFKAGNDIMLFSDGVKEGKEKILRAIASGEIPEKRLEESVKKILRTKYDLGLTSFTPLSPEGIATAFDSSSHRALNEKLYLSALTLLKDEKNLLPLDCTKEYYHLPLEEAPNAEFSLALSTYTTPKKVSSTQALALEEPSTIIVSLHKDNSTAYKPFTISKESKALLEKLKRKHQIVLLLFGSPYGLKDVDLDGISTVLVAYENNPSAMRAAAKSLSGSHPITGKLPVQVRPGLEEGAGTDFYPTTNPNTPSAQGGATH